MTEVKVRYLPELTEQEAIRILQKRFDEEGQDNYKVYKPKSDFKGFVVQNKHRGDGMKVAVRVELEQKKSKTSFKVKDYEESAARGWFYFFYTLIRLPIAILYMIQQIKSKEQPESSDSDFMTTDYEREKESMVREIVDFLSNVPEFRRDPAEEFGKGLSQMMNLITKLGGYKPDDSSRVDK